MLTIGLVALFCSSFAWAGGALDGEAPLPIAKPKLRAALYPNTTLTVNTTLIKTPGDYVRVSWSEFNDPFYRDYIALYVLREGSGPAAPRRAALSVPATRFAGGRARLDPSEELAWLGLDISRQAPVKYYRLSDSPGYGGESGFVDLEMLNLRHPQVFVLFRAAKTDEGLDAAAAVSRPVQFINPNAPTNIHLMLTGRQGEVRIQWTQGASVGWAGQDPNAALDSLCSEGAGPQVVWGEAGNEPVMQACARTTTYTVDEMCGGAAAGEGWADPGLLHEARLFAMQPRDEVRYRVGDPRYGWSEPLTFRVPTVTQPDSGLKFIAIADVGQANVDGSRQVENWDSYFSGSVNVSAILASDDTWTPDMLLHVGDVSYARGYVWEWDLFHHLNKEVMGRTPWMVAIGNHERDWPDSGSAYTGLDSGGECGIAYQRRFPMPGTDGERPWYSYTMGPVTFVVMSTEHDFTMKSEQRGWIEATLAGVDREKTPWVVFGGHRPLYVSSTFAEGPDSDVTVAQQLQNFVEPLLVKYGVDLALWGHHHSYQRTCPVSRLACVARPDAAAAAASEGPGQPVDVVDTYTDPGAPVHLVIGNGGAGFSHTFIHPQPDYIQLALLAHGYIRVEVKGRESLRVTAVEAVPGGAVLDEFVLRKTRPLGA